MVLKSRTVVKIGLGLLAVAAVIVGVRLLPVGRWAGALIEKAHGAGAVGVLLFAAAYVIAPLLFFPASILTIGGGFLYGSLRGTALVLGCALATACLGFLLGRTLLRSWVRRRIERDPKLAAVDSAIGAHGFRLVLLLRLSPVVPFNLLNYALGASEVKFWPYAAASLIGMLPATFLYVSIGAAATSAAQLQSGVHTPKALLWVGIAATVAVVIVLTLVARKALQRALPEPKSAAEASR